MIEKKEILEEMNNRSREVFRRVVEGYLTDGEPVGSRTLSREFSEDISAATIRNVMQDLEFLGLLGSPHTSAGRIPTQLGLRMFVDGILEVSEVDKNDRKKIDKIVSDETNQVEDILDDISTTLSGVTQGASLVLTPKREAPIKHVEFLPLSTSQALVVLVFADGHVENRLFKPPPGQTPSSMKEAANFLNSMGAKISGAGTDKIIVEGVEELSGTTYEIPADRIEAGTYLIAGAVTNGNITINKIDPERMGAIIENLKKAGAEVISNGKSISIDMTNQILKPVNIITAPFPGFPTDMQAQFTVLNCMGQGESRVKETIFENRFMHIQELNRMGTNIRIDGTTAIINGVDSISGAQVMATDLRASASLILAGLVAKGETIVDRIYHIDRGYERIEEKLNYLGADITRLPN